jgi:transposase
LASDFNPIEKAFAKLKSVLRKLAERTVVGLLAVLKPAECENYFMARGYDTT